MTPPSGSRLRLYQTSRLSDCQAFRRLTSRASRLSRCTCRGQSAAPVWGRKIAPQRCLHQIVELRAWIPASAFRHRYYFFSFPQRVAAALLPISRRRLGVSFAARALPPTRPPLRAHSCRSTAVIEAALSFAKATAAGFFFVFTTPIIHELN